MQFCKYWASKKKKKKKKNDFVYGELGRVNYVTKGYYIIIKYWFKVLSTSENKFVRIVYNMMLNDLEDLPNKTNWASLVRN